MRLLVAGVLVSASVCLADEPPIDPQTTPAPATESAGVASSTPDGASDAAQTAESAESDTAAVAEESAREKMEDDALRKEGYKIKEIDGEKRYCKKDSVLGSRLNTRTICWTADQIKANRANADILRDKQNQRRTGGV